MMPINADSATAEALRGPDGEWYPVLPSHRRAGTRAYYLPAAEAATDARLIARSEALAMLAEIRRPVKRRKRSGRVLVGAVTGRDYTGRMGR